MNAYELAEQIGKHAQLLDNLTDFPKGVKDLRDSANMLRQQADEKAELTGKFVKLADENNHLKDRIAELEKKELTDEEIEEVIRKHWNREYGNRNMLTLCRAVLEEANK